MPYTQKTLTFNIPSQLLTILNMTVDELVVEIAKQNGYTEGDADEFVKNQITDFLITPTILKIIEQKKDAEKIQLQLGVKEMIQQDKSA
jgi:hypothetical protein